ncbi:MAG TPA: beta-galactosidase, partial [Candidatus Lokiarchaeia archaeon]|nr:beta-galactosidase [Candidatus Lokiarchaeia archaeon]
MDDTRFGICHFEMINPTEWFTGLPENINDPLLLKSAVMLRDAGMAWNRFEFAWSTVEPQPGAWDWSALDAYMNLSDYYGLRVLPILAYGVGWACKDPNNYLSPITNLTAWREYINATVTRYKDRPSIGGYWQIWNEANIAPFFAGDFVTDFLPIMVAGAEAVKQADPTAKVVATALTSDDMGGIITQMVNGIGKDKFNALFDAVDIHPYAGDVQRVTRKIQDAKDALAGWYSGELWITEVGWSVNPATAGSEADIGKAQDIAKVLVESRVLNVTHTLVHMWCDWGDVINGVKVQNATNPEHWYGLVDINANPKPSYYAYKTVANAIGLASYQGDPTTAGLNFAPEIEAHVFKRSNSMWVVVLWNPEDRIIPLTLLLPGAGDVMVQNTTG